MWFYILKLSKLYIDYWRLIWIQNIILTIFIFILFNIIFIYFILVDDKQISQFWSIA